MSSTIQELFSPPIGLKVVMSIDGFKLYSSDKLKKAFLQSMAKTSTAKIINPVLEKLVSKGLVTPCFQNKGIIKNFAYKFFASSIDKSIAGFFDTVTSKVVILVDNEINVFGFSSNYNLAVITLHECTHMFAKRKPSAFLSTFKQELRTYYGSAFTNIFQLKSKIKNLDNIIKFIFDLEKKGDTSNSMLLSYYYLLDVALHPITVLSDKEFEKILRGFISFIKISLVSLSTLSRELRNFSYIVGPLYRAYKDTFNVPNRSTTCFQELTIPSEVICVGVELKPTSKNAKAFKMLT